MEPKIWKIDIHFDSDPLWLDKTFRFEVKADEREAQILLDTIILGAELKDIKVGGGMASVE
jgi:hypothetical protein